MFIDFFPENRAVYEKMSKSTVEPARPQMTMCRMGAARWISRLPRANTCTRPRPQQRMHPHAYTHRGMCNTYCFSTATMVS